MPKRKRVYSAYDKAYQAQPEQVEKRVARNKARRHAVKKHGAAALKGKDVHHPAGNAKGRTRVISRSKNRAMK